MLRFRTNVWAGVCVLAVMVPALTGCNRSSGPSPTQQAQIQFEQGDYARAQVTAARASVTAGGDEHDLAHYMAGISAYRMGNMNTAERYLRVAAQSDDPSLSADASSTLGLIYSRMGLYAQAAEAFQRGASLQRGEDRAQAYYYAGIAQQKLGQWPQARTSLLLARKSTRNAGLMGKIEKQLAVTGYTVQVGAFANRANADRQAASYKARVSKAQLGTMHITTGVASDGRTIHLVQVGRYATFGAASDARSRLGDFNAVIVPLQ